MSFRLFFVISLQLGLVMGQQSANPFSSGVKETVYDINLYISIPPCRFCRSARTSAVSLLLSVEFLQRLQSNSEPLISTGGSHESQFAGCHLRTEQFTQRGRHTGSHWNSQSSEEQTKYGAQRSD